MWCANAAIFRIASCRALFASILWMFDAITANLAKLSSSHTAPCRRRPLRRATMLTPSTTIITPYLFTMVTALIAVQLVAVSLNMATRWCASRLQDGSPTSLRRTTLSPWAMRVCAIGVGPTVHGLFTNPPHLSHVLVTSVKLSWAQVLLAAARRHHHRRRRAVALVRHSAAILARTFR